MSLPGAADCRITKNFLHSTASDYQIIVGSSDIGSGLQFSVQEIVVSPHYKPSWPYNDIALLFVLRPFNFGLFVQPACLPRTDLTYTGQSAIILGFGTLYYAGPLADDLQETSVRIMKQEACENIYGKGRFGTDFFTKGVTDDLICAGQPGGGADACLVRAVTLLLSTTMYLIGLMIAG